MIERGRKLISVIRAHRPLSLSLACATLLYLLFGLGLLKTWTPMGYSYQFDHHTLTRCGLAIRYGTNIFTSTEDYKWFGYHGSNWASLPGICLVGVPLSYLPPNFSFWLMDAVYFLIHATVLILFGFRLQRGPGNDWLRRDFIAFAALGFFFPWFIIYVLGQYHAIVVLALALVLYSESGIFWGFLLSALGKPILAPGILPLAIAKRWKTIVRLGLICAVFYLPWVLFDYTASQGLTFGSNRNFQHFFGNASMVSQYSVYRWNQEMGWSKVFEELFSMAVNLRIRRAMGLTMLAGSLWLAWRGKLREALCVIPLIYLTVQGRSHEYHLTLYTPLLAYLYTREDGAYRTRWMTLLIVLAACPTVFPFFKWCFGLPDQIPSSQQMLAASPLLYGVWLVQKPIVSVLVFGTIVRRDIFGRVSPTS